jgi:hypothetical protein
MKMPSRLCRFPPTIRYSTLSAHQLEPQLGSLPRQTLFHQRTCELQAKRVLYITSSLGISREMTSVNSGRQGQGNLGLTLTADPVVVVLKKAC